MTTGVVVALGLFVAQAIFAWRDLLWRWSSRRAAMRFAFETISALAIDESFRLPPIEDFVAGQSSPFSLASSP